MLRQTGKIMAKSSVITYRLSITMAGLKTDYLFQFWLARLSFNQRNASKVSFFVVFFVFFLFFFCLKVKTNVWVTWLKVVLSFSRQIKTIFSMFYSGLMLLSTIDEVWMLKGTQCSHRECCLAEISCQRHTTWCFTQSYYTDMGWPIPIPNSTFLTS